MLPNSKSLLVACMFRTRYSSQNKSSLCVPLFAHQYENVGAHDGDQAPVTDRESHLHWSLFATSCEPGNLLQQTRLDDKSYTLEFCPHSGPCFSRRMCKRCLSLDSNPPLDSQLSLRVECVIQDCIMPTSPLLSRSSFASDSKWIVTTAIAWFRLRS